MKQLRLFKLVVLLIAAFFVQDSRAQPSGGSVESVSFSPDGTTLAAGFGSSGRGWVLLLDVATREVIATLEGRDWTDVSSVSFSPDGTTLAVGTQNWNGSYWRGRVRLLDVSTREEIATVEGRDWAKVSSVSFSPDGAMLAAGLGPPWDDNGSGRVLLLDGATLEEVATLEIATLAGWDGAEVFSVSFSPDGTTLAAGIRDWGDSSLSQNRVVLWDVTTREVVATFKEPEDRDWVSSVSFSPDGTTLAVGIQGYWGGRVRLLDAATLEEIAALEMPMGGLSIISLAFSPDGTTLATGIWDNSRGTTEIWRGWVMLWNVASRGVIATLEEPGDFDEATSLAFSPDGTTLAAGTWHSRILLWDVATREAFTLDGTRFEVHSLAFSPDGTTLAAGFATLWEEDGMVQLWNVGRTPEVVATLEGESSQFADGVGSVAFSPDGRLLAAGDRAGRILLWDVGREEVIATLKEEFADIAVAFSPDGRLVATGTSPLGQSAWGGRVRLWDVATRKAVATLELASIGDVSSVSFSPDGTTLAAGLVRLEGNDSGRVLLLDGATLEEIAILGWEGWDVTSLAFSPDGATLAAGLERWDDSGGSGRVLLLDGATLEEIATPGWEGHMVRSLAFSPDATTLAVGDGMTLVGDGTWWWNSGDGTVRLWDVATLGEVATLEWEGPVVRSLAFSPDGTTLAVGDRDRIRLWDVATREAVAILEGRRYGAGPVVFAPDPITVVAGSHDNTVDLPKALQLHQNVPNPFNSQTILPFFLPKAGQVRLEVFSVTGQRVALLRDGPQPAGYHRFQWNARDAAGPLASGPYFYRLVTDEGVLTRKLILLR